MRRDVRANPVRRNRSEVFEQNRNRLPPDRRLGNVCLFPRGRQITRFVIASNAVGECSWWLYDREGREALAWAGDTFSSARTAHLACRVFIHRSQELRWNVFQGTGGAWRWRAWAGGARVATSTRGFASRDEAEQAAERARDRGEPFTVENRVVITDVTPTTAAESSASGTGERPPRGRSI